jgi:hypothetical protein
MKDLSLLKILVKEWTQKAQNSCYLDIERETFYSCAQELHQIIFKLEEQESLCIN